MRGRGGEGRGWVWVGLLFGMGSGLALRLGPGSKSSVGNARLTTVKEGGSVPGGGCDLVGG